MSSRSWQRLSQVLALLLVVLVGAAAMVAFLRPGTPAATPPPSNIAAVSPTPTDPVNESPSATPGPSRTPKPPKSPRPTQTATPTPRPTATPVPSETAVPGTPRPSEPATVPARRIQFVGLGFDSTAATTPKARTIAFDTDGPGTVTAKLSQATAADLHFCLQRVGGSPTCQDGDHANLSGTTSASGKTSWVVTGIGTGADSPIADVTIDFGAIHPNVSISDFRFQGTASEGFNGVEADLNNLPGTIKVRGTLTSAHPWRVRLVQGGQDQVANQTGNSNAIAFQADATTAGLHLSVAGTEIVTQEEVFLSATVRWQ